MKRLAPVALVLLALLFLPASSAREKGARAGLPAWIGETQTYCTVPVLPDDTPEALAARHPCDPEAEQDGGRPRDHRPPLVARHSVPCEVRPTDLGASGGEYFLLATRHQSRWTR